MDGYNCVRRSCGFQGLGEGYRWLYVGPCVFLNWGWERG